MSRRKIFGGRGVLTGRMPMLPGSRTPAPSPTPPPPGPLTEAGAQASSLCRNRQDACSPGFFPHRCRGAIYCALIGLDKSSPYRGLRGGCGGRAEPVAQASPPAEVPGPPPTTIFPPASSSPGRRSAARPRWCAGWWRVLKEGRRGFIPGRCEWRGAGWGLRSSPWTAGSPGSATWTFPAPAGGEIRGGPGGPPPGGLAGPGPGPRGRAHRGGRSGQNGVPLAPLCRGPGWPVVGSRAAFDYGGGKRRGLYLPHQNQTRSPAHHRPCGQSGCPAGNYSQNACRSLRGAAGPLVNKTGKPGLRRPFPAHSIIFP
jgi:hypothetical protein